ncbi:hypothetical protein ALP84_200036 [Pseudomonas cichorii]|uniref:DUF637 domain-containing protein n=1 Tax=Pseudomonas cichorii TaxID=36746 RepID=A0A3M4VUH9_PSECI|nr:hypothetical protein ALP84_200036 [Pseudomonas cichorii]
MNAGGSIALNAGQDLAVISSRITAGENANLSAGENLSILAAQDSDYYLYDKKSKGSWGKKKTKRDEVTDIRNVGSEITSGGDLTLESGGDQLYQVAKLTSGNDLTIDSGGGITFEGVKDLHQESHTKSNNDAFWTSSKGKGSTDETLRQTQMVAKGELTIKAVNGLKIDIKQVDQQTVTQTIDAMVQADPQLAWLKEAEKRGDVDWRQVKEIHESFKYSNSGLGPASQIIIAIVMAAVVGPMAMGAVGTATGGAVAAGTMSASTATLLGAGAGAIAAGAATNASVSFINNGGNLGAVFKDVTSSDAMKGYLISGVTAGLTSAYFDGLTGTHFDQATQKLVGAPLDTLKGIGQFAGNQLLQAGTSTLLSKALGVESSGSDALKNALFNTLAAASFNAVGDYTHNVFETGTPPKIIIHAMVGGLLSKATGGDFKTGALAAGANEALVGHLNTLVSGNESLLSMSSQIVGVLAAASQKDADASSIQKGAWIANNATQYNLLSDHARQARDNAREAYQNEGRVESAKKLVTLENADQRSDNLLEVYRTNPDSLTRADRVELAAYIQVYVAQQTATYGSEQAQASLANLLRNGSTINGYPYAGTSDAKIAYSDAIRAELSFAEQFGWSRDQSQNEQIYHDAKGLLLNNNHMQGLANIGNPAIYVLSGSLGATIRIAAAANGVLQASYGAQQAINGDAWNAAGNIAFGALGILGGLGIPGAKPAGLATPKIGGAVAEGGAATKGVAGTPAWSSSEGVYSSKLPGDYTLESAVFNKQFVDDLGDFSSGLGAKGAGTLANAERGTLTEANFAQNKIKSDRSFSEDGQKVYSELAGTQIKTVDDLAGALRAGTIKPNQLPVDYVDMNGARLILNTRTSTALEQAAIPRSEWFGRNQTGVEAYPGKTFNDLAADQLKNNKLPPTGAEQLKSVLP